MPLVCLFYFILFCKFIIVSFEMVEKPRKGVELAS